MYFPRIVLFLITICLTQAHALPIDWHGAFGVDSTVIDNYRRIDRTNQSVPVDTGSQEATLGPGNHANASFQSYVFRLNPVMVVNDSATFKAEITSGYGRGGRLGDNASTSQQSGFGNALYGQNLAGGNDDRDDLSLNKFFMELYSDTATYVIGRHSAHWGLGAVLNSGDDTWDRHTFVRDGITINVKLGNFNVSPFWAKVSSGSLTRADNVKEYGISLFYDNAEKDLAFGLHYAKKKNNSFNSSIVSSATTTDLDGVNGSTDALGRTDTDVVDIYIKKSFGDLSLALEVPLYSGDIGFLTNNITQAKYKAKAFIFEGDYKANDNWKFGTNVGMVSGDDGNLSSFDAMYLNPNYQIANLLFRYNLNAIGNTNNTINVYDSYINNSLYIKGFVEWSPSEKWTFDAAVIKATAQETARAGDASAFNHTTNTFFTPVTTQSDDLGLEFDLGFEYRWNNEVTIGGDFGFLSAGEYWAFTNSTTNVNKADNSMLLQIRTSIAF